MLGCHVDLVFDGTVFSGKTNDKECPSSLYGAKYATSKIVMGSDSLQTQDRGFDEKDNQIWGAEKGADSFMKRK